MKGNQLVIEHLQMALTAELTAVHQFTAHGEMLRDWGLDSLADRWTSEAAEEMEHARKFAARMLFLEGVPELGNVSELNVGLAPKSQIENDLGIELSQVKRLNQAVVVAREQGDGGSRELFEEILVDEEKHVDWLEAQLDLIKMMGVENYLAEQMREGGN